MDTTIAKGMTLIEYLAGCDEPKNLHEIVAALGLSKSNVHRLLRTFIELGYVRQVGAKGRYTLTTKLWEFGVKAISQLDFPQVARPHLVRLSEDTGETALLAILDGMEVLYMDRITGDQPIGVFNRIGRRAPAWANATGRVILANRMIDVSMFADKLTRYTSQTICEPAELAAEFEKVRTQGFALTAGEWHEGVYGLAAPVFDAYGAVAGSVGITGTIAQYESNLSKEWHIGVVAAARAISEELGMRHKPAKSVTMLSTPKSSSS
ncbi:helix-turn-helix domain-containing protein [Rhizobium lusitanum]|uniref:Helix-turn-helix domain-containing protein n=1 Tax=Rhizobium lusitanum TaxID=293958 RepID=A0A6L9UB43_9HYPH|nr:IclR family transcriptional regulator [Rhizobium lusitanum]NEI73143.1 helix-turn-helix domain-containing protein [Rhizobium lusitanum]